MRGLWFVLVCTLVAGAQQSSNSAVQTRIIAMEKAWNQAYKMGDTRALDALLDDEPQNILSLRAESHADADFSCSLLHGVGDGSINSDGREHQCGSGKPSE